MDTKTKPKASHYLLLGILAMGVSYGCTSSLHNSGATETPTNIFLCGVAVIAYIISIFILMAAVGIAGFSEKKPDTKTCVVLGIILLGICYGSLQMSEQYDVPDGQSILSSWWFSITLVSFFASLFSFSVPSMIASDKRNGYDDYDD